MHIRRQAVALEPQLLYAVQELEVAGFGVVASSIRSDFSRGRWPAPDDTTDSVNRCYGQTATAVLATRHGYHRSTGE